MTQYEYKVLPAPTKGRKGKGVKGPEGRFAHSLQELMNDMGTKGWEFQRAETLPSEERSGLTSSSTVFRSVLVFRRPRADDASVFAPRALETPVVAELPAPEPPLTADAEAASSPENAKTDAPDPTDNEEETGSGIPDAIEARVHSLKQG